MVNKPRYQTVLLFLMQETIMEHTLKGLGEDDLKLAILTTLFRVLFLISTLFKTHNFNIIKKDWFFKIPLQKDRFLKLNFKLLPQGFFKRLGLFSCHERSAGDKDVMLLKNHLLFFC